MYPPVDTVISNILDQHTGEQNAISLDDLINQVNRYSRDHIFGKSEIRGVVHDLRKNGSLICSSDQGYYRPATLNEGLAFVDRALRTPAKDELVTARIQRAALKEYFGGQLSMSFGSED